jgi:putative Mn2+ efflux pump MntP
MSLFDLFILAVGLSMDAMAVAVCKGLSVQKLKFRHALITGLYFGGFQAAMPLLGYLLGIRFQAYIESVDHWIAFILLGVIGANMIKESFGEAEEVNCSFCPRAMLPMAVATSIDALAVGVTFAFLGVDIVPAVSFIGVITFTLSAAGVYIGHLFGAKFKSKAELTGGIVLVLMGLRILLEHLGVIEWFLGLFS